MPDNIRTKIHRIPAEEKVATLYPYARLNIKPQFQRYMPDPEGVTIHYTAGGSPESSITYLKAQNYGYHLLIDREGAIHQMYYLDSTCSHSGNAYWQGKSPNRYFISIALCNYGKLISRKGGVIANAYGRIMKNHAFRYGEHWEPCTPEQESALLDVSLWLCNNLNINPDNVCGHEECAVPAGRKIDPGGALSFSMPEFREMLRQEI